MPLKEIVKIWNEQELLFQNIDFLHKKTSPVKFPLSEEDSNLIEDLIDSYKVIPCAGIAANQIGTNKSIFIGMKTCDDEQEAKQIERMESQAEKNKSEGNLQPDNYEIYINPKVTKTNDKSTQCDSEGCLSVPGIAIESVRYNRIRVRYQLIDGTVVRKPLKGFISRLFQHETDHLNGILMFNLALSKNIIDISPKKGKPIELIKEYYDKFY